MIWESAVVWWNWWRKRSTVERLIDAAFAHAKKAGRRRAHFYADVIVSPGSPSHHRDVLFQILQADGMHASIILTPPEFAEAARHIAQLEDDAKRGREKDPHDL